MEVSEEDGELVPCDIVAATAKVRRDLDSLDRSCLECGWVEFVGKGWYVEPLIGVLLLLPLVGTSGVLLLLPLLPLEARLLDPELLVLGCCLGELPRARWLGPEADPAALAR